MCSFRTAGARRLTFGRTFAFRPTMLPSAAIPGINNCGVRRGLDNPGAGSDASCDDSDYKEAKRELQTFVDESQKLKSALEEAIEKYGPRRVGLVTMPTKRLRAVLVSRMRELS
jgi:hypothetical protein